MHTLFLLSALLLAGVLGGLGALGLRLAPVGARRPLALVVLAAPPFVLGLAGFHIVPRFWPECAPIAGWDLVASSALVLAVGSIAVIAVGVNLARLMLVERLLAVCPPLGEGGIAPTVARLGGRLGINTPLLRVLEVDLPLAVGGGLRQPTIVLSRWLIERLEHREVEAVLAHELAHLAQRDYLTRWLGRLLRDMMVYLPGAWYALRVLEADEELVADALAVEATNRPLAMARALGKIWRGSTQTQPLAIAGLPGYAGNATLLEERLSRLLDDRAKCPSSLAAWLLAGVGLALVTGLVPRLLAASAFPLVCSAHSF
ncbi:MAG: M56 family metallopeptidase [Chloroflexi bacterium]|nr:M56 family metallopeptidase [Chloroflexota bacterium]